MPNSSCSLALFLRFLSIRPSQTFCRQILAPKANEFIATTAQPPLSFFALTGIAFLTFSTTLKSAHVLFSPCHCCCQITRPKSPPAPRRSFIRQWTVTANCHCFWHDAPNWYGPAWLTVPECRNRFTSDLSGGGQFCNLTKSKFRYR